MTVGELWKVLMKCDPSDKVMIINNHKMSDVVDATVCYDQDSGVRMLSILEHKESDGNDC